MQITDGASVLLNKMLSDEGKNCVTFFTQGQGCHTQVMMDFVESETCKEMNGVSILMDPMTEELLKDTILDVNDYGLIIKGTMSGGCGGCGSGCGSDCEGGCGGCCGE